MASVTTKVGHGLAKVLGIKLNYRECEGQANAEGKVTRGESVFSISSADTYVEEEPSSWEWIAEHTPSRRGMINYGKSLFPFTSWITRYNGQWLIGDLVAGITIGAVVVPQGMAYAKLADLPVQYGLYSAFMGTLIYWFFATSKDITIGPVAVMSTIVGTVVIEANKTNPEIPGPVIASAMAIIAGAIVAFLGLVRLGWIVDFISLTAVSAFITGSAFNIAMGQVPGLLGISSTYVNNRESTYIVVINTLKNLKHAKLDAALGLTGLFLLYLLKYGFRYLQKAYPKRAKGLFFAQTLRTIFVILLYTLISWLVNRNHKSKPLFTILSTVPRGFTAAGVPKINTSIIKIFAGQIPSTVIVLLIEHIAIAKSFGRINNYQINPSQELLAIGVTNLLGPFLGAYPATGSFSRTAIKSKAGVRTPLAGIFSAIVVLLAIYALPAVFFYVPSAILSAVIIHAVLDLITPANTLYQFWRISPLEVFIFLAGVFVTVFSSIENGIYTTIVVSAALLLWRVAKAQGRFLGRVTVHTVVGDYADSEEKERFNGKAAADSRATQLKKRDNDLTTRNVFLPIDKRDGTNPMIDVTRPYPGIFVYRFSEGYNYPNASHYLDYMVNTIFSETRRTDAVKFARPGDRPWNDPGPKKGMEDKSFDQSKPALKAVILDFSSVNNVDVTSVQHMIDVRNQLDRYTSPETVEWHIACINNRWTKRALASAGFGFPTPPSDSGEFRRWKPIYSVAEMGGEQSAAAAAERKYNERLRLATSNDPEAAHPQPLAAQEVPSSSSSDREAVDQTEGFDKQLSNSKAYNRNSTSGAETNKVAVVHGLNRPLFHIDLTSALQSAIASAESKEESRSDLPRKGYGTWA